jgi:hypothetical protein
MLPIGNIDELAMRRRSDVLESAQVDLQFALGTMAVKRAHH